MSPMMSRRKMVGDFMKEDSISERPCRISHSSSLSLDARMLHSTEDFASGEGGKYIYGGGTLNHS